MRDTTDFILKAKFKSFLESIPANQNGLFRGDKSVNVTNIFVLVAIQQALSSLHIPELGDYPQLTTDEVRLLLVTLLETLELLLCICIFGIIEYLISESQVTSILKAMDKNADAGLTLQELRSWLTRD